MACNGVERGGIGWQKHTAEPRHVSLGSAIRSAIAPSPGLHERGTVDGAGHWLHQEQPGIVNDLILSFADTVRADTAT